MIKKVVYIGNPCYISTKNEQLVISIRETDEQNKIPIEDIGVLELDNVQITISNYCLQKLSDEGVIVVICKENHHPIGIISPIENNTLHSLRLKHQINAIKPLNKQLWQQLIITKIKNQSMLLEKTGKDFVDVNQKAKSVKSGDSSNQEAQASQLYWKRLFDNKGFIRDRNGTYPNNLLNYGYSILRAMTARAIVSAGLHPAIGIHHKNQYNPFCLADDLMEPYRPFVDEMVQKMYYENLSSDELNTGTKKHLLGISLKNVDINNIIHPMMNGIQITASSLVKCYTRERKLLELPILCNSADIE